MILMLATSGFGFEPLIADRVSYEGDRTPDVADALGHAWSPNSGGSELTQTSIANGIASFHWYDDWTNYTKLEGMRSFNTIANHSMDVGGTGVTVEFKMAVTAGFLELSCNEGSRSLQVDFKPQGITFLTTPVRTLTVDLTVMRQIRMMVKDGNLTVWVDDEVPALYEIPLNVTTAGTGGMDLYGRTTGYHDFKLDYLRIARSAISLIEPTPTPTIGPTPVPAPPVELFPPAVAGGPRVIESAGIRIRVGETRTIIREAAFPAAFVAFNDGSMIITAVSQEGGSANQARSTDRGQTWKPLQSGVAFMVHMQNGQSLNTGLAPTAIPGRPGYYQVTRYISSDNGLTYQVYTDGTLYLPPDQFPATDIHWFHGNYIQAPNGDVLSVLQGGAKVADNAFRCYLVKSSNQGKDWTFVSMVASLATIDDPDGRISQGWKNFGPVEPSILHLGGNNLICAMRLVDDDTAPLVASPTSTYHNLFYTLLGSEIYGASAPSIGQSQYATPGPRTTPLILTRSTDGGATWSPAVPMDPQCGMMPQLQASSGIIALSYGGLAYPRWGNCVTFSRDGGQTWTEEINYAPFHTSGYSGLVVTGPGKFMCAFDASPPQPWTRHQAHWVGVVEFECELIP